MLNKKGFVSLINAILIGFISSSAAEEPVVYLKMNEGAGTVVSDKSPSGNDGALSGSVWVNNVLEFDGLDDYVNIPDSDSLDVTDEITILVWVKPYSFSNSAYEGIVHKSNDGTRGQNMLRYQKVIFIYRQIFLHCV
ncbi:MAG: hypothetical protein V3T17_04610 [Pseudomonadales bacterium]